VKNGRIVFDKDHFPLEVVERTLTFIKQKIEEVKSSDLSLISAINIALKIENGMIENNYFKIFSADSERFKKVLNDLEKGTMDHIHDIESKRIEVESFLNIK